MRENEAEEFRDGPACPHPDRRMSASGQIETSLKTPDFPSSGMAGTLKSATPKKDDE